MTNQPHQGKFRIAFWQIGLGLFLFVGALVGLYFAFEYTLIAEFRESQLQIDESDSYAYGEALFQTRGCTGCHSHDGFGSVGDEGPDLTRLHQRADAAYITESIVSPNAVIAENCPEGACEANVMPNYGNILTTEQVDALVVFLSTELSN